MFRFIIRSTLVTVLRSTALVCVCVGLWYTNPKSRLKKALYRGCARVATRARRREW